MADRKDQLLTELRRNGAAMSIIELAERLAVHPNTVRFHLRGLLDDGRVEPVEEVRGARGRPALMFRAHRGMDPAGPRDYQLLAGALAGVVGIISTEDPAAVAVQAGHAQGSRLAHRSRVDADESTHGEVDADDEGRLKRLTAILSDLGFAPVPIHDNKQWLGLRNCPFLELIPEHSSVICSMHLGLMRGALAAMDASITVTHLEPFAEPDLCVAHLGTPSSRKAPHTSGTNT